MQKSKRGLKKGTLLPATLLVAALMLPLASALDPTESQVCADYKGDNAGYGGDKYTECNADPDSGEVVSFVCADPSGNAISVTANDPDADAKGKLRCGTELVGQCHFYQTCEAHGEYDGGAVGTKVEGDCLGGTEEFADSGMAWACASVGAGVCSSSECDAQGVVREAQRKVEEAKDKVTNRTTTPTPIEYELKVSLSEMFFYNPGLQSLALGIVNDDGTALGMVCQAGLCEQRPVGCETGEDGRICAISHESTLLS